MEGLVPQDILIHILNVVILYVLLRVILFNPVKKFMDQRTEKLRAQKEDAENALASAEEKKKEYESLLSHAEEDGGKVLSDAKKQALAEKEKILESARQESETILKEAKEAAQKEKEEALHSMQHEVGELAAELAGKIMAREVKLADNDKVVDDFFREMNEHE